MYRIIKVIFLMLKYLKSTQVIQVFGFPRYDSIQNHKIFVKCFYITHSTFSYPALYRTAVAQSVEFSSLHWRESGSRLTWRKLPCTQMALGACKIRRGCNVLPYNSHPNYTSGDTKAGETSPPGRIKIAMACLRIILRDESQTICNSPLAQLQSDVKTYPTQPTVGSKIRQETGIF